MPPSSSASGIATSNVHLLPRIDTPARRKRRPDPEAAADLDMLDLIAVHSPLPLYIVHEDGTAEMHDPCWGTVIDRTAQPGMSEMCWAGCCPCVRCCSRQQVRKAWSIACRSWSIAVLVVQVIVLIFSLSAERWKGEHAVSALRPP